MIEPSRSFDRVAAEYERARPGYPPELLDAVPLGADAVVLDLGAGTGKLTRVLVERYARVTAVEPLDGMRGILEAVVPAAESLRGTAEAIPLPGASVNAVFAAQAFHWFANEEAMAEIARVLRPGGILCLVWNEPLDSRALPEAYRAYLRTLHAPSLDAVRSGPSWSEVISGGPFSDLEEAVVEHEQTQERGDVLAFARSVSWIAHRPEDERERIMQELNERLPEGPFTFTMHANLNWPVRT